MRLSVLICLLMLTRFATAQPDASATTQMPQTTYGTIDSSYLPLHVGNVWNARITDGLNYLDWGFRYFRVLDSLNIGDTRYVTCHHLWYPYPTRLDTARMDTLGTLWRLHGGQEQPLFKFNAAVGDTWSFTPSDSPSDPPFNVTYVGLLDSFQLPEGPLRTQVFRQVKVFFGEAPGVYDSWINIAFARGVGVIYRSWWSMYQVLYGASIDGRVIGDTTLTSIAESPRGIVQGFALYQNYPNPCNPTTTIGFVLPHRADVRLTIFNILGQTMADLHIGVHEAGVHEIKFNGSHLPSGVYFYRLSAGDNVQTKKFVLLH